jgi:hypothetical protein
MRIDGVVKSFILEAYKTHYYFGVLRYVTMIVEFVTTKKMESFYDTITVEPLE